MNKTRWAAGARWREENGGLAGGYADQPLTSPLALDSRPSALGRLTYTGGFVLPGDTASPGQTPLPPDLEQAAVEQVAYWFQNRDKLGLLRYWPKDGIYLQLSGLDLLPSVSAILQKYKRWTI